jgi:hypothetical protein
MRSPRHGVPGKPETAKEAALAKGRTRAWRAIARTGGACWSMSLNVGADAPLRPDSRGHFDGLPWPRQRHKYRPTLPPHCHPYPQAWRPCVMCIAKEPSLTPTIASLAAGLNAPLRKPRRQANTGLGLAMSVGHSRDVAGANRSSQGTRADEPVIDLQIILRHAGRSEPFFEAPSHLSTI